MEDNCLVHYGILGMKWGVRRSEAQLARARGELKSSNKGGKKSTKKSTKKSSKSESSNGEKKKKKISEMSDDELRAEINRLSLVKQYKDLMSSVAPKTTPKESKARQVVNEILIDSTKNIGKQAVTYVMGKGANKLLGKVFDDAAAVNPKKGQKDKG